MSLVELIILGVALSMDAFAVTISNSFAYSGMSRKRALLMPLFFGVFQGLMPAIGYFAGSLVSDVINQYAGIVTVAILGFIGGKMIYDAVTEEDDDEVSAAQLTIPTLFFQAIATSIDALAVGVSFAALSVDVGISCSIIALTTALCCTGAVLVGRRFGHALGNKATIIGGMALIAIGLKALLF